MYVLVQGRRELNLADGTTKIIENEWIKTTTGGYTHMTGQIIPQAAHHIVQHEMDKILQEERDANVALIARTRVNPAVPFDTRSNWKNFAMIDLVEPDIDEFEWLSDMTIKLRQRNPIRMEYMRNRMEYYTERINTALTENNAETTQSKSNLHVSLDTKYTNKASLIITRSSEWTNETLTQFITEWANIEKQRQHFLSGEEKQREQLRIERLEQESLDYARRNGQGETETTSSEPVVETWKETRK